MSLIERAIVEDDATLIDFMENGHDRGCGPSFFPGQVRVDVSLSLELEQWLRETACNYDMTRAELIRAVLNSARTLKKDAQTKTHRYIKQAS